MNGEIETFLKQYDDSVADAAMQFDAVITGTIPGIKAELDLSARIVGYGFGAGYADTICTVIPSRKGLKIGFYRGAALYDPARLLTGTGKVHSHVPIRDRHDLESPAFIALLKDAYAHYLGRKK